jgi:ferredoxin
VFGAIHDPTILPDFPPEAAGQTFRLQVQIGGLSTEIPARGSETLLVALERANLAPPAHCRSGECGWCRSRLVRGQVYVNSKGDGRRAADRHLGYVHPCATWPLSDLEIQVPRS